MPNLPTCSEEERVPLREWIDRALRDPAWDGDHIHLDELVGPWSDVRDGLQWVAYSCDVLTELRGYILLERNPWIRFVVVALPLEESTSIQLWEPSYWLAAGMGFEPPSIYLINNDRFFYDRFDEEYFRKIDLPIGSGADVSAVYKSQRRITNSESAEYFGNAIFLVLTLTIGDRVTVS